MDLNDRDRKIAVLTAIVQTMMAKQFGRIGGDGPEEFERAGNNDDPLALAIGATLSPGGDRTRLRVERPPAAHGRRRAGGNPGRFLPERGAAQAGARDARRERRRRRSADNGGRAR